MHSKHFRVHPYHPVVRILRSFQSRHRPFLLYRYRNRGAHPFHVTKLTLHDPDVDRHLAKRKLVFLSDLHFRGHPIEDFLLHYLSGFPWDVLLLGGDYLTEYKRDIHAFWTEQFFSKFRLHFPDRTTIAVLGNHDKGVIYRILTRFHIHVLSNDTFVFEKEKDGFYLGLAGVDDPHKGKPDWFSVLVKIEKAQEIPLWIVLAHSPDLLQTFVNPGHVRLILAGHTHGGQIALGYHRPLWINTQVGRMYASGLARYDEAWVYTSRGFGYTYTRFRVFCPPEIVQIAFKHSSSEKLQVEEEWWLGEKSGEISQLLRKSETLYYV